MTPFDFKNNIQLSVSLTVRRGRQKKITRSVVLHPVRMRIVNPEQNAKPSFSAIRRSSLELQMLPINKCLVVESALIHTTFTLAVKIDY
jgi:hypothetical protein